MWPEISIHAPVKGATRRGAFLHLEPPYFNPRSREGSDLSKWHRPRTPEYFNPRSREGSDQDLDRSTDMATNFNPRSREGSDTYRCVSWSIVSGFQSTLP